MSAGSGSFHVAVGLPDGRSAYADYRLPVTHVMHRVNKRIMTMTRAAAQAASAGDFAILGRWLDNNPDQACSPWHCVMHGPTGDEPPGWRPPPYHEDVLF